MESAVSNNYLSQSEASALAGVSTSTLMRFAEAGYFKVIEKNGQTQFSKTEIYEVFGPAITASTSKPAESTTSRPETEFKSTLVNTSPLSQQIEKIIEPSTFQESESLQTNEIQQPQAEAISSSAVNESNQASIDAFKNVLQLQEELLSQKESRIADLIKERDWLRNRLEKMEDKSDRDQMLLMVESQKVRTLIDKGNQKNGIIRLALDWFGGKQEQVSANTTSENK